MTLGIAATIVTRCVLAAMVFVVAQADALAKDVLVKGAGSAVYSGPTPDAMAREAALHEAKVDCVSNYIGSLATKLHPLPVEYRNYFHLAFHPELQERLDEYLSGVTIQREWTDGADKRYRVIVGATLNEERFRATLSWPKGD